MFANDNRYELKRQNKIVDKGFYEIDKGYGYVFAVCSASKIDDLKIINEGI